MDIQSLLAALRGQSQGGATGPSQTVGATFQPQQMEQPTPQANPLASGMQAMASGMQGQQHKQLQAALQARMAGANGAGATGVAGAGLAGGAGLVGLGAKALNDTGISSYEDSMKGKAWSNMVDAIGAGNGSLGQGMKAAGDFASGNFGGAAKNGVDAVKSFFTLKWL